MASSGSAARRAWSAAAAIAALGAWLALGGPAWLRSRLESPETGIRRALAGPGASGSRPIPGTDAALRLDRLRFADLVVTAREEGAGAVAVADLEGAVAWRGREIALASVGVERFTAARCAPAGWCAEAGGLPRLAALLAVLLHRADAFDEADAARYRPLVSDGYRGPEGGKAELLRRLAADLGASPRARLRPLAWQIRIERETAQVGEDFEVEVGAAKPRRLRARLELRDEGGRWRITGGL